MKNKGVKIEHHKRWLLLLMVFVSASGYLFSQITPGMIIKPASGAGRLILDPDGDGYVSAKTNGVQLGFTIPPNDDVSQSEIPFVAVVKPDPQGDLLRGPKGGFSEIVGVDAAGNNAILTFTDGVNLFYRFRLDSYSPNTTSYSILLDTDGKFGFTGANADPNAIAGNAGFEIEIVLQTNFAVKVYNVDGRTNGIEVYSASYDTNCQKAVAVSTTSGNPDYFYDFFVPLSALTSIVFSPPTYPESITAETPLRYAAVTSMNPSPAIGNNAVSDIGGVTGSGNLDLIFTDLINEQTPTVPGQEVLERSDCPSISPVLTTSTSISGSSTEMNGTIITIKVYNQDQSQLLRTGITTVHNSTWSFPVADFSPALTLTEGQKVKATAQAEGKGVSADDCSIRTVSACITKSSLALITGVNVPSSGKGPTIANTAVSGSVFTLYNASFAIASISGVTNPITIGANNASVVFECSTGNCFPNGVYYVTVKQPGECESDFYSLCVGISATSATPVITTTNLSTTTTQISGTGVSGAVVYIYAGGYLLGTANVVSGQWNFAVSGLIACQQITARQLEAGKCMSVLSNAIDVKRKAAVPSILSSACVTAPFDVRGTSIEADGTTVTLYQNNSSGAVIGTTTVSNGEWVVSDLMLPAGTQIVAKVTSGTCLLPGDDSTPVIITTKTNISDYSIGVSNPVEGQLFISGTISGSEFPVTLKLYVNDVLTGSGVIVNQPGVWSINDLLPYDLYLGAELSVSVETAYTCESDVLETNAYVTCLPPAVAEYSGGSYTYCAGGVGLVQLSTSEVGVIYQLVNAQGVAQGPSVVGNGSDVVLNTYVLNASNIGLFVKAFKLLNPSCFITSDDAIDFDTEADVPTINIPNSVVLVVKGDVNASLSFSDKSTNPLASKYMIEYSFVAKNQGFVDVPATILPSNDISLSIPAGADVGTYQAVITILSDDENSCVSRLGFTIVLYNPISAPLISTQPLSSSVCSGDDLTLSVVAASSVAINYQWQVSSTFNGVWSDLIGETGSTLNLNSVSTSGYYRAKVSNSNGVTYSNVSTMTLLQVPESALSITGSQSVRPNDTYVAYSIPAIAGATSYEWTYTGTGVVIYGNSNTIYVSFSANATSGNLNVVGVNSCGQGDASFISLSVISKSKLISNKNITQKVK